MTPSPLARRETTVLNRATIVVGDGTDRIRNGALVLAGGRIVDVRDEPVDDSATVYADAGVVDVDGSLVLPGLINCHMHRVVDTPSTAAAGSPPGPEVAAENRDRHLLAGNTTVVDADAFALPDEVEAARTDHPLKVEFGACPTPRTIETAVSSGGDLSDRHRDATVADVLEAGAVYLGEVGSKNTLTGGSQRDTVIPDRIRDLTGVEVTPTQAERLIDAVVGRRANPDEQSTDDVAAALADLDLAGDLSPPDCRSLVTDAIMPAVRATRKSFAEVGDFAAAYGVPVLVHTSGPTEDATRELAARDLRLVAGHVNHPTFTPTEARSLAADLQDREGVTVEASSWDLFGDRTRDGVDVDFLEELFLDLVGDGLVDVVATDYANDYWHGLLVTLQTIVERDVLPLEAAVALVTGNVVEAFPSVGATRGTLERGKAADVLVVDPDDLTRIERLYVDGALVVADGRFLTDGSVGSPPDHDAA